MPKSMKGAGWKGPTVRAIAEMAGVGPASVDRVLNHRPGVKEATRQKVVAALDKLTAQQTDARVLNIALFCTSGPAFNDQLAQAVQTVNRTVPGVEVRAHFETTQEIDAPLFAARMEKAGLDADGVVVVAHEHPAINGAIRKLTSAGTPVVCLTTDLPSSRRSAYVGNDQYAAGSVAAQLIGQILPQQNQSILLVMSIPFRCQQEREMGFRRVLRTEFSHLRIEERMISNDNPDTTRAQVLRYLETNGAPAAVYNVAGANRGVAGALEEAGLARSTIFIGHELTPFSRAIIEAGTMDYVISHDFAAELTAAVRSIDEHLNGGECATVNSQILIHTRFNCGL